MVDMNMYIDILMAGVFFIILIMLIWVLGSLIIDSLSNGKRKNDE